MRSWLRASRLRNLSAPGASAETLLWSSFSGSMLVASLSMPLLWAEPESFPPLLLLELLLGLPLSLRAVPGVHTVPQLEVAARLRNNRSRLWFADGQILLDEAVPAHHHVDGTAEKPNKVDKDGALGLVCVGYIQGPKHLAGDAKGLQAHVGRHVGKGIVGFALAAVFVKGDGVVKRVADLG
ncbi:hypothetical protein PspLS_01881 [Pyricularia sp. CBS 133598]|nr:hypothetical protein PspLS_01881 [Pyricularia sp. CBS 133598]